MNSFLNRFYFLSKLSTSLFLLIILIFISFLFIKAYLNQNFLNEENTDIIQLSSQIHDLKLMIEQNSDNITSAKNIIHENKNLFKNIFLNLENLDDKQNNQDLILKINNLFEENKKINNQLKEVATLINNLKQGDYFIPENTKVSKTKENLIKLIKIKLNTGLNFANEVNLLQNLNLTDEQIPYFEKLLIYSTQDFIGLENLNKEFKKSSSFYLNNYYLEKNNNYLIQYLFNLVSIEPNLNNNIIKDQNILLLSLAKKSLLEKKIEDSIKKINKLASNEVFFLTWKKQAKYYVEVNFLLNKF